MNRLLVVALLVGACGDDGGVTIDAAVTPDSASPDASVDASVDAPPVAKEGQIFLGEARSTTNSTPVVSGMFMNGPVYVTLASADGCDAIDDMPASSLAAGSITVTGTTSDVTLAQQNGPNSPYYSNSATPADLFAAGATLTVTTTGAIVPAFTGDVVAPQPLADVVFPDSISRAAPATFTWTAGTSDTMWFLVASADATPGGMLCTAPDNGSFTLTTDAIALLPPAVTQLTIVAYRMNEVPVTAGAWTVYVRAADGVLAETTTLGP